VIDGAGGFAMIALRFAVLTATMGALGAWLFGRFVVTAAVGEPAQRRRADLARFGGLVAMFSTAAVVLAAIPRVMVQAQSLADQGERLGDVMIAVLGTRWGWALCAQSAAALVALVALWRESHIGSRSRAADIAVVALAVVPAFMSHAVADPDHRLVSMLIDVVHVAAAGGWVGTLAVLTLASWRHRRDAEAPALIAALVVAFHPLALVAAPAVFVTGLGTAWLRMGAPVGIANPAYSGLFVAKLLIVGVTGVLGAGHSKQAKKRVQKVDVSGIGRTLLGETLLAVLVLAVTAILVGTAPLG
jgi:putative copper resistance protein D